MRILAYYCQGLYNTVITLENGGVMSKAYKIVYNGGTGEIVEKKSRFIANVFPVSEEEEALAIIEKIKKQYWDARHNCYAYVIGINA